MNTFVDNFMRKILQVTSSYSKSLLRTPKVQTEAGRKTSAFQVDLTELDAAVRTETSILRFKQIANNFNDFYHDVHFL